MPKSVATPPQFRSGEMEFGFDEIHALIACPMETAGSSSFTALLELSPPQAVELLVNDDFPTKHPPPPPIFASDTVLIDRASMFSVFASAQNSPESNAILPISSPIETDAVKQEPMDSSPTVSNQSLKSGKRKEREKRAKESDKKSKKEPNEGCEDGDEKLPYVHVRARRGQATNSHSLAERARREKINARMKLLQELVPGCDKISGTAMVLDEIINHVQALQRQVEFLSMRLAAVNPRIDFNLDALLAAESGISIDNSYMGVFSPSIMPEEQINHCREPQYRQLVHGNELHQPVWVKEEDNNSNLITPDNSHLSYDSANSVSHHLSQLKMEL